MAKIAGDFQEPDKAAAGNRAWKPRPPKGRFLSDKPSLSCREEYVHNLHYAIAKNRAVQEQPAGQNPFTTKCTNDTKRNPWGCAPSLNMTRPLSWLIR